MWLFQLPYWTYSIHWLCLTLFTGRWWRRLLSMWRLPNSKPNNEYLGFSLSRVCLQVIPFTLLADCPHFLDKVWFVFLLIIECTYERKFYKITFDTCHSRVQSSNWCFLISKLLSDPELSNFTYTFYVLYFSCCVISVLISRKLRPLSLWPVTFLRSCRVLNLFFYYCRKTEAKSLEPPPTSSFSSSSSSSSSKHSTSKSAPNSAPPLPQAMPPAPGPYGHSNHAPPYGAPPMGPYAGGQYPAHPPAPGPYGQGSFNPPYNQGDPNFSNYQNWGYSQPGYGAYPNQGWANTGGGGGGGGGPGFNYWVLAPSFRSVFKYFLLIF